MNRRKFLVGVGAAGVAGAIGMPRLSAEPAEQLTFATQWITIDQLRELYPPAETVELLDDYYRPRMMNLLREAMK